YFCAFIDPKALHRQRTAYRVARTTRSTPRFAPGGPLVIAVGCGRAVKVWDVESGRCIRTLPGHTSTVRAVLMLPCTCGRSKLWYRTSRSPTASRDGTLRTFDLRVGRARAVLANHTGPVRCIDADIDARGAVRCVSGGADGVVRIWAPLAHPPSGAAATLAPLRSLHGHHSQIYALAYCGARGIIASGGADTTIRVWNADDGPPLLDGKLVDAELDEPLLTSGGADGRIMLFSLAGLKGKPPRNASAPSSTGPSSSGSTTPSVSAPITLARIPAHDQSVTALQVDWRWGIIFSSGADGAARVWDVRRALGVGRRDAGAAASREIADAEEQGLLEPIPERHGSTGRLGPVSVYHRAPTPSYGPSAYTYARELTAPARAVWKVVADPANRSTLVVLCLRNGRSVVEVWKMGDDKEGDLEGE
ncbi:WD40-repeat-containing domain protein, partial [Schizophyllum amplum]